MVEQHFFGVSIYTLGGDDIRIKENTYTLTPGKHKALSSSSYSGKTMKDDNDILTFKKILEDIGYTGKSDKKWKRKEINFSELIKKVDEIDNRN